jgi:hypothetical protein
MEPLEELATWFDQGVADGADFMIVARDMFSHEDYAIYVRGSVELATQRAREIEHAPMSLALEVYDLKGDREAQLAMDSCWAVPEPEPGEERRLMEEALRELTVRVGWKA